MSFTVRVQHFVEEVRAHRITPRGRQFLLHFFGTPSREDTWEYEENIPDARLLHEYFQTRPPMAGWRPWCLLSSRPGLFFRITDYIADRLAYGDVPLLCRALLDFKYRRDLPLTGEIQLPVELVLFDFAPKPGRRHLALDFGGYGVQITRVTLCLHITGEDVRVSNTHTDILLFSSFPNRPRLGGPPVIRRR